LTRVAGRAASWTSAARAVGVMVHGGLGKDGWTGDGVRVAGIASD
jgi:hypothetical protein